MPLGECRGRARGRRSRGDGGMRAGTHVKAPERRRNDGRNGNGAFQVTPLNAVRQYSTPPRRRHGKCRDLLPYALYIAPSRDRGVGIALQWQSQGQKRDAAAAFGPDLDGGDPSTCYCFECTRCFLELGAIPLHSPFGLGCRPSRRIKRHVAVRPSPRSLQCTRPRAPTSPHSIYTHYTDMTSRTPPPLI